MKKRILKILRITPEEVGPVSLVLAIGFCVGLFLATITVASTTLFLNSYSETKDLPVAVLISGVLAVVFTSVYNFFQGRISFNKLSIYTLLIIILLTSFIEFGDLWIENVNQLYYFGFTLILPFIYIARLVFWGTFNHMFSVQQARRIVSIIDLGMDIASVLAFFAIPIILQLGVDVVSIFSVSLFSAIACLSLYTVVKSSSLHLQQSKEEEMITKKVSINNFFKSRYMLSLSLFVILSTVIARFVDYAFFNVTANQFDTQDLPYFLSYFEATIILFSFLFTVFVTDRINHEYGIRISLLINPLLMLVFMSGSWGLGYFMGYDPNLSSTTYFFFIMVAMSKLFIDSMKEAIDDPTIKLYYIPFDKSIKNDIQTKIEGIVMGFSSFFAGLIIVIINIFKIFSLLSIILFVIAAIPMWFWIINYMYKNYLKTLRASLEQNKSKIDIDTTKEYTLQSMLKEKISEKIEKKVVYSLKLMEKLDPGLFKESIKKLAESPLKKIKKYATNKIKEWASEGYGENTIRGLAEQAAGSAQHSEMIAISPEKLVLLGKSIKQSDKLLAAKLLTQLTDEKTIFTLLDLLRDQDPKVREAALTTAGIVKRPETWNILIEMLDSPIHSNHATTTLKDIGKDALDQLNFAFYKTGQSDIMKQKIIEIISATESVKSTVMMWQKIRYPDAKIVNRILHELGDKRKTLEGEKALFIKGLLDTEMKKMLWNMAALSELPDQKEFNFINEALEEEVDDNYEQIILLLSLLYDKPSVELVKKNIDSKSSEGTAYAIELLNLFVDPDLKVKLIPLLETSSTREKPEKLQSFFPREHYTPIILIDMILNRSASHINRWTKLCATHVIAHYKEFKTTQSLIAQIFNQDKILQETAAWTIYNKDPKTYQSIVKRIPPKEKTFLDASIENNQLSHALEDGHFLKIEIIMFIKTLPYFKNIKGRLLCEIADKIEQIILQKGEKKKLHPNEDENPILIVAYGQVNLVTVDQDRIPMKKGELIGEIFQNNLNSKIDRIEATEYTVVFSISNTDFYFLLANHHEIAHNLIENEGITKQAVS